MMVYEGQREDEIESGEGKITKVIVNLCRMCNFYFVLFFCGETGVKEGKYRFKEISQQTLRIEVRI